MSSTVRVLKSSVLDQDSRDPDLIFIVNAESGSGSRFLMIKNSKNYS
jgi:hypothetical protein